MDIGNEVNIPPGCEIIDARNKHVCPGIIDAHSHLGLCEEIYRVEGDDLNEDIEPVSAAAGCRWYKLLGYRVSGCITRWSDESTGGTR